MLITYNVTKFHGVNYCSLDLTAKTNSTQKLLAVWYIVTWVAQKSKAKLVRYFPYCTRSLVQYGKGANQLGNYTTWCINTKVQDCTQRHYTLTLQPFF